ncbi:MAG: energy-coupling factor ABC transporter substrate-binding protein [Bacillota bacterium]|nr:energy-coupling factor ABC transporter substrate-binding protein [Bacillota bacterium]
MSNEKKSNNTVLVIVMLLACVIIAIIPLMSIRDSEFGGADGQAEEVIGEIAPDYEPWAESILEPPGGETESLLFCLQAALGAGIFGFGIGTLRERSKAKKTQENSESPKGKGKKTKKDAVTL